MLKMSSAHGLCRPQPYECDTMFSAVRYHVFSGACVELPDVFQETALCRCYPVVIINSRQSHVVGPGHKRRYLVLSRTGSSFLAFSRYPVVIITWVRSSWLEWRCSRTQCSLSLGFILTWVRTYPVLMITWVHSSLSEGAHVPDAHYHLGTSYNNHYQSSPVPCSRPRS